MIWMMLMLFSLLLIFIVHLMLSILFLFLKWKVLSLQFLFLNLSSIFINWWHFYVMKTVYSRFDNIISIKIVSDKGSFVHSRACVTFSEYLSSLQVDSISIHNIDLTPVKFSCFCRMVSNTSIQLLLSRADKDFVEFDPEFDFEFR